MYIGGVFETSILFFEGKLSLLTYTFSEYTASMTLNLKTPNKIGENIEVMFSREDVMRGCIDRMITKFKSKSRWV